MSPIPPERRVLGLTLRERHESGAKKAGFAEIPFSFSGRLYSAEGWKKLAAKAGLSSKDWVDLREEEDIPSAEKWLLQGLVKDTEGFMSKHLERKISLSVTRILVNTSVTPNQMTLFSVALGLVGALYFLPEGRVYHTAGALLFWLHSVLDGCDGEIARLKFQESRFGGLLDFLGDNVVHSAVFACIAYRSAAPVLGALAVLGTLAAALWVYWTTMRPKKETGPLFTSVAEDSATGRFLDFLARRDFIYLVLILAIFGKIHWFLVLGAVGAPIYFLILVILSLRSRQPS